jgi:hypothetical protein
MLSATALGNPASFSITGGAGGGFSIVLPSSVTLTGPGTSIQLTSLTSNPSSVGTFGAGGTATLSVGGTLGISANQAAGIYSGSFSVTVNYN